MSNKESSAYCPMIHEFYVQFLFYLFQCILDYFGSKEETVRVSCQLEDNKVILSESGHDGLLLKVKVM